jgi:hypothetical protein
MGLGAAGGKALGIATKPLLTGEVDPLITSIKETAKEFAANAAIAGGARLLTDLGAKAIGPLRRRFFAPGATSAQTQAAREELEPRGGVLTPTMLSGEETPAAVSMAENVARSGMGSAGTFSQMDLANEKALMAYAKELVDRFGALVSEQDLGKLLRQEVSEGVRLGAQASRQAHQVVDQITRGGIKVDTTTLLQKTPGVYDLTLTDLKIPAVRAIVKYLGGPQRVRELTQTQIAAAVPPKYIAIPGWSPFAQKAGVPAQISNSVSFADADLLHSQLLAYVRDAGASLDPAVKAARRLAKNLAFRLKHKPGTMGAQDPGGAIDQALAQAEQTMPGATQAFQAAKQFTAEVKERLEGALLNSMMKKLSTQPETILGALLSTASGAERISLLDAVREAAPQTFPKIQQGLFTRILKDATKKESLTGLDARLDGKQIIKYLDDMDPLFMRQALGADREVALRRLANALEVAGRRPEGPGRIFIQLAQAGAATAVLKAPFGATPFQRARAATLILLGPYAIGRIFTDPRAMKNLAEGLIGGPKSAAFRRAIVALSAQGPPGEELKRRMEEGFAAFQLPTLMESMYPPYPRFEQATTPPTPPTPREP